MDSEKKKLICRILYGTALLTASIPLFCGYIMEGGESLVWVRRIEEIASGISQGKWIWFPSLDAVSGGGEMHALNSNLWLFIPGLIRAISGSVNAAYLIFMLFVHIVTLYSAVKLFGRLFEDKLTAAFGVLLYMTCPYRVWLCYDQKDLGKAAAWMLVPLFLWGMVGIYRHGLKWREIFIASVSLAGIGYGDSVMLFAAAGCAVLGMIWHRKAAGVLPVLAGGALYLPGAVPLVKYLVRGGMEEWNLSLQSIMGKGYTFAQFFSSFAYQEGRPGLGLGLFGALLALIWLCFIGDVRGTMKQYGYYIAVSLLLLGMSLSAFPWDFVQRVHPVFLRLVSLFDTPGIFFGFGSLFLCIPAAYGVENLWKQDKKFVQRLPFIIAIAAIGVAVYLCNDLTYTRNAL